MRLDAQGKLVHGVQATDAAHATLQRRYSDFLSPTNNTLAAFERFRGTRIQREFRRGDLGFAALEPLPDADDDAPSTTYRVRRFLRDVLETLYY
jgi:hypothetical protein